LHRESDFDEIEAWLGDGQVRENCRFMLHFPVGENDSWVLPVAFLLKGPIPLNKMKDKTAHACEGIQKKNEN
jgi:hypothetical protein